MAAGAVSERGGFGRPRDPAHVGRATREQEDGGYDEYGQACRGYQKAHELTIRDGQDHEEQSGNPDERERKLGREPRPPPTPQESPDHPLAEQAPQNHKQ